MSSADTSSGEGPSVVFSDVDGTLVHYPNEAEIEALLRRSEQNNSGAQSPASSERKMLLLPASATGKVAVISSKTLRLCRDIRRQRVRIRQGQRHIGGTGDNVKLVLVSGMRTPTLLQRLPYLPRADAYCSEVGGRVFLLSETGPSTPSDCATDSRGRCYKIVPQPFEGATPDDLEPYFICEDVEWRNRMEDQDVGAGKDGYRGNELPSLLDDEDKGRAKHQLKPVPISERDGVLWEFAQTLVDKGVVLDTKGYSTCFRVNAKQQSGAANKKFDDDGNPIKTASSSSSSTISPLFDALLNKQEIEIPPAIASSVNLGCIDYYPAISGKKNWYVRTGILLDNRLQYELFSIAHKALTRYRWISLSSSLFPLQLPVPRGEVLGKFRYRRHVGTVRVRVRRRQRRRNGVGVSTRLYTVLGFG